MLTFNALNRRVVSRALALALPLALVLPAVAIADGDGAPLSRRDLKRVQREAETALSTRDLGGAIARSEQLIAALPDGDPRRADALYTMALALLLRSEEASDVARATAALGELGDSYSGFKNAAEVEIALAGLRGQAELRQAAEVHDRELAELRSQLDAGAAEVRTCRLEIAELREAGSAQNTAAEAEAEALRAEVTQLRSRLADVEDELQKKEEALQKVKATLVGG